MLSTRIPGRIPLATESAYDRLAVLSSEALSSGARVLADFADSADTSPNSFAELLVPQPVARSMAPVSSATADRSVASAPASARRRAQRETRWPEAR